jgi:hypothetical protein
LVGHPDYYKKFGFKNVTDLVHEGVPQEVFSVVKTKPNMRNVGTASLKWVKFAFKESQSEWHLYWATGSPWAQIQGDLHLEKSA